MINRTRGRVSFEPVGESLTKQGPAYDADINVIVGKFVKTGDASAFNQRAGVYGDFSDGGDYLSCLNRIREADAAFGALPAKVREQFGNSPGELLAAWSDPARRDELVSAGIVLPTPGSAAVAASASQGDRVGASPPAGSTSVSSSTSS